VVGANVPALLATIMLRLRGTDVVTLGRVPQPLFSPSRLKGLTGWKHVWMSPALRQAELVEETGARYTSTSDTSFESATEKFGPFDLIVAASADESSMLSLTRGLAASGVLLDLTLYGDALYPGWLCRMRESFAEARQSPVLLQS
jgi:hypothetical protein